jgi:hypothetical protein
MNIYLSEHQMRKKGCTQLAAPSDKVYQLLAHGRWFSPDTFIVGVLQADTGVIRDGKQIFRLFCHESMRVFHDRLINNEDKNYFYL